MELTPLAAVDASSLRWLRRSEAPVEFHLLAGDAPVATLTLKDGPGALSTARTATGTWTLKRVGFLNPTVTARTAGATTNLARLSVHWNHHRIEMVGGASYRFHRAGVLLPAWQVVSEAGGEVLHIEPVRDGRTLVGGAVIAPAEATRLAEFPLLVLVAWFFIVLAWFEDEALIPLEGPGSP